MRKLILFALFAGLFAGELLQPYIYIGETGKGLKSTVKQIQSVLFMKNVDVATKFTPLHDNQQIVLMLSNRKLKKAAEKLGAEGIFFSHFPLVVQAKGDLTYVTCRNPEYWGRAILGEKYALLEDDLQEFLQRIVKSMKSMRRKTMRPYGSANGIKSELLPNYKYKLKSIFFKVEFPGVDDKLLLAEYSSYGMAIEQVEKKLKKNAEIELHYSSELSKQSAKLFGVQIKGELGNSYFMNLVQSEYRDFTPCLPLEIFVLENKVYALAPAYRIPLSNPDLDKKTMRSILKKYTKRYKKFLESIFN